MSKATRNIIISVIITVVLLLGFFLLPDCKNYGGYQMGGSDPAAWCDCRGLEVYYIDEAPADGVSASKCIGFAQNNVI